MHETVELNELSVPRPSPPGSTTSSEQAQSEDDGYSRAEDDRIRAIDENDVVSEKPRSNLLGWYTVACIIANRMIGIGIFDTPTSILQQDHNAGTSLVLWIIGFVVALCGSLIYTEFGLSVPRGIVDGQEKCTPRNGGELVYLKHILGKGRRAKFLAGYLFGIPFTLVGSAAPEAVSFGYHFMRGIGKTPTHSTIAGVASAATALTCLIHGIWRKLGVLLNNVFATIKVLMLVVIIGIDIAGLCRNGRPMHSDQPYANDNTETIQCDTGLNASANLGHETFHAIGRTSDGLASYIQVVFTFGGFNQANYVLGEIENPGRIFQMTSIMTVTLVGLLYVLVNVAYLAVVPVAGQPNLLNNSGQRCPDRSMSQELFALYTGSRKPYDWFVAFSSLGNIVVTTFTAARVKQEIAKEGIFVWSEQRGKNFLIRLAEDQPLLSMLRNLLCRLRLTCMDTIETHSDEAITTGTPAFALFVHLCFTSILIVATLGLHHLPDTYGVLLSIYSFCIDAPFAVCLGAGILWLRWRSRHRAPERTWNHISNACPSVSMTAASVILLANLFPLIALLIPSLSDEDYSFFVVPTIGTPVLALAVGYWLSSEYSMWRNMWDLEVERKSLFLDSRTGRGTDLRETVNFYFTRWQAHD